MNLTYKELIRVAELGIHTHVNNQEGNDFCKQCGEHLLHAVHLGLDRFAKETDHFKCMME